MMLNRRTFLKRTAFGSALVSGFPLFRTLGADAARKLNCVQIGCGGRGMNHLEWLVNQSKDNLVAIVDPDEKRQVAIKKWLADKGPDPDKLQVFTDYRRMFEKIGKDLDAVFIATPNHHHAPAATMAVELGKGVYCEKPLCHDIAEARKLRELARNAKAPTQMGNQGHCEEGYRSLCEAVWAGVVGNIIETHSWTDRANGGVGPRPPSEPPPAGLHWEEWLGPAPYRDFHEDIHPHEWHGWYDFGNGSLGNMGCHVLDGVFWALKLDHPHTIEMEYVRDGSDERYPTGSRIRWDYAARGSMAPVKVYWYEGLKPGAALDAASGKLRTVKGAARNLPPLLDELQKQYPDEEFDTNGTLYVGEKGILYTATYGGKMHLLPFEKWQTMKHPDRTLPRPKNIFTDFLEACRNGSKETAASFEYGAQLTEFTLLGNLAQHAGVGRKIQWNGAEMKASNLPELGRWVACPHRKGWPA